MTSPFKHIQNRPASSKALLGISYQQFQSLVECAEQYEEQQQEQREKEKTRINAKGGGRPPKLSIAEGLCLCLFYLRHAPTFEVLGLLFEVSKTTANDVFHYWLKVLRNLLPASLYEEIGQEGDNWSEFQKYLEQHRLLVDSTEQDRARPQDNREQKEYYSGKKKRHTFKSSVISLPEGKDIVDVTAGHRGPESDISLFRQQQKKFSEQQRFEGDKAYVGAKHMTTPHKKPRNGELTEQQREENKIISSSRIFIEHLIRRIKISRIAQGRFPLRSICYETVIMTICGLVRFRFGTFKLPIHEAA